MKPPPFAYHRPQSVSEAVTLLAELGDEAKVLAGGQSLVAMMNFRIVRPSALVDIGRLRELDYVLAQDGGEHSTLRIGGLARHRDIECYPGALDGFEVLPRAARYVGHYPIRTQGTFCGSLAHADPAAEWCLLALLLDARITARSHRGAREIPAADFFQGFLTSALAPDELLTEVRFDRPRAHAALTEFTRRHGDFMVVGAAVAYDVEGGRCRDARVVLGGVDATPVRIHEAEDVLEGEPLEPDVFAEAGAAAARAIDPPSDVHGSGVYRQEVASVMVRRAAQEASQHDG